MRELADDTFCSGLVVDVVPSQASRVITRRNGFYMKWMMVHLFALLTSSRVRFSNIKD